MLAKFKNICLSYGSLQEYTVLEKLAFLLLGVFKDLVWDVSSPLWILVVYATLVECKQKWEYTQLTWALMSLREHPMEK